MRTLILFCPTFAEQARTSRLKLKILKDEAGTTLRPCLEAGLPFRHMPHFETKPFRAFLQNGRANLSQVYLPPYAFVKVAPFQISLNFLKNCIRSSLH